MRNKRKIIGSLIIIIALIFSIGLISLAENKNSINTVQKKYNVGNPFLSFKTNENTEKITINDEHNKKNLTEIMAKAYVEEIQKRNPDGLKNLNQIKVPSLKTLNINEGKLTEEIEKIFDEDRYNEKDIKISSDNSIEAQKKYIEEINKISEKNYQKFNSYPMESINKWITTQDTSDIEKYVNAVSFQVYDLLNVMVPLSLKKFHLKNINLWYKKMLIYNSFLKIENDPLKGIIALKEILQIREDGFIIQSMLNNKIKELNIHL